jgi:hypothetical protein
MSMFRMRPPHRGGLAALSGLAMAATVGGVLIALPRSAPLAASAAAKATVRSAVAITAESPYPAPAASTLVVNANDGMRPVTHVASGALYGLADDLTPSDDFVTPLHPNTFVQMAPGGRQLPNGEAAPAGDALVVAPKAARAGAGVIVRAPDWYPDFPYQWVSWSNWLSAIDTQVAAIKASGDRNVEALALWNEPDWNWPTAAAGMSFNAGWVKTYDEVKAQDPHLPIDGPSISYFDAPFMESFLSYAKANNALPDIVSWHELQGASSIAADVSAFRTMEASLGISPRPIVIEEYATPTEVGVPGALVSYIAKFERAGVQSADLAFWNHYGTLGDLLTDTGGLPNGAWWLYKWYGDMTGEMVDTVPPAQTGIDGAASVNPAKNLVSVIFGNGSGSAQVTINGLNDLSAFGDTAHVVLQTVTSPGRTTPVSAPTTIFDGDLPVTNGTVTVPVAAMNPGYGYHVLLSPADRSAPGLDGTYRITAGSAASNGRALTIAGASAWPGALATTAAPNGAQSQLWSLVGTGTGYYKVIDDADGLLLGASPDSPAAVVQLRDDGSAAGLWRVTPGKSGFALVNKATGQALSLTRDGGVELGDAADLAFAASQRWALTAASLVKPGASYTIANLNSALNLDTPGGSVAPGTLVDQENPNGAADQDWTIASTGTGFYNIVNKGSGLLLGIQNQSTSLGANAAMEPADSAADQLWQLVPNGAGAYWLANAGSGLLLGVSGEGVTPGTLTLQWTDNGTPDHLWTITPN